MPAVRAGGEVVRSTADNRLALWLFLGLLGWLLATAGGHLYSSDEETVLASALQLSRGEGLAIYADAEQHIVLLPDMVAEEADVLGSSIAHGRARLFVALIGGRQIPPDVRQQLASQGVLMEHHPYGAALDRHTAAGQDREQGFLFLGVVEPVGVLDEKIERLSHERCRERGFG